MSKQQHETRQDWFFGWFTPNTKHRTGRRSGTEKRETRLGLSWITRGTGGRVHIMHDQLNLLHRDLSRLCGQGPVAEPGLVQIPARRTAGGTAGERGGPKGTSNVGDRRTPPPLGSRSRRRALKSRYPCFLILPRRRLSLPLLVSFHLTSCRFLLLPVALQLPPARLRVCPLAERMLSNCGHWAFDMG